ncbi:MAG: lysine transporter LysE [Hyphomicrobiales bacterium]|nr:MAG: lysine transporter LysE [Hyphomicrobiales bacterium]
MILETILLYSAVAFFYVISPGPAAFLAISNAMTASMRIVVISTLGNISGLFLLSAISIIGLGALLTTSATLFMIIKYLGAGYLIYLGIKQFFIARNSLTGEKSGNASRPVRSGWSYYSEAFILAATNPKPILFFVALFPQFLNTSSAIAPQFFVMTGIFMMFSFMSLCSYGYLSRIARGWLNNPERMKWFHRVTGGLFIALGLTLTQLRNA